MMRRIIDSLKIFFNFIRKKVVVALCERRRYFFLNQIGKKIFKVFSIFVYKKEDFITYRDIPWCDRQVYMCYNAAHPKLWSKIFNIKSINLGYFLLFNTSLFNSYLIIIAFSALILYQNVIIIIQIINIVIYFIYCQLTNFF